MRRFFALPAPSWQASIGCFALVGTAVAPLHALANARAFATMPSQIALVNAAAQLAMLATRRASDART